jgi:hypothetical protein
MICIPKKQPKRESEKRQEGNGCPAKKESALEEEDVNRTNYS